MTRKQRPGTMYKPSTEKQSGPYKRFGKILADAPPRWPESACAELTRNEIISADIFTPENNSEDARLAKSVCSQCPVQPSCLAFALDNKNIQGVWGGALFLGPASHRRIKRLLRGE